MQVNLVPILNFVMQVGIYANKRIERKLKKSSDMQDSVDSLYQLNIVGTGVLDDLPDVVKLIRNPKWHRLPILVNFISLTPS